MVHFEEKRRQVAGDPSAARSRTDSLRVPRCGWLRTRRRPLLSSAPRTAKHESSPKRNACDGRVPHGQAPDARRGTLGPALARIRSGLTTITDLLGQGVSLEDVQAPGRVTPTRARRGSTTGATRGSRATSWIGFRFEDHAALGTSDVATGHSRGLAKLENSCSDPRDSGLRHLQILCVLFGKRT
jgi:hypothetical protein